MKEKRKNKEKHKHKEKKHKKKHSEEKRRHDSSSSQSSEDQWIEKTAKPEPNAPEAPREDWMAMTGMIPTYSNQEKKSERSKKEQEKRHIDSYNPATSVRELNPYWKDGGGGLPSSKPAKPFLKPNNDDSFYGSSSSNSKKPRDNHNFYGKNRDRPQEKSESNWRKREDLDNSHRSLNSSRSSDRHTDKRSDYANSHPGSHSKSYDSSDSNSYRKPNDDEYFSSSTEKYPKKEYYTSSNRNNKDHTDIQEQPKFKADSYGYTVTNVPELKDQEVMDTSDKQSKTDKYLTDEQMNKLGAKIVKAEIMGDATLVKKLQDKLQQAREYRKHNPDAGADSDDEGVLLMATSSKGDYRPLKKSENVGDSRSKGGKRKAETHSSGERMKYFANDEKYSLAEMFEQEKYGTNYDNDAQLAEITAKHKNPNDDLEDIFTDEISKNKHQGKEDEKNRQRAIKEHTKLEKSLEGCEFCIGSKNMLKHLMVSCGSKVYLAVPGKKSLVKAQCIITTIQHSTCVTSVDEDVWEEIMDYRKALTKLFNSRGEDVVFFETASKLQRYPHMVIHCVPIPREEVDSVAIYFKKAILECEAEWSMNKKVIDLKGKNIRRGVPKGLPYFWIDFAMEPGFAHVIEDQQLFPMNFAEEVIGGILDLDHNLFKNPKREYGEVQRKKVLDFVQMWKPFDTIAKK